eukprot:m.223608 g.223608  ORF g.223608 m.223608 type:complete len:166 (-) comp16281_c0_seq1:1946-2443(-)
MADQVPTRDPCPYRILDDFGGAFAMGAIGGGVWHGVRGYRASPVGQKLYGSLSAIKTRAPVLGGSFAVWGGMFSAFDCSLIAIRGKEDPWNSIISGALTGGALSARMGVKSSVQAAFFGGVVLAMIEGLMIGLNRLSAEAAKPVMSEIPEDPLSKMGGQQKSRAF